MILLLEVMMENILILFEKQKTVDKPRESSVVIIDNPPILPLPRYRNQVIFPSGVVDGFPFHRFFASYRNGIIYALDPASKSAKKVPLEGYEAKDSVRIT